jgi:hypothetical protein
VLILSGALALGLAGCSATAGGGTGGGVTTSPSAAASGSAALAAVTGSTKALSQTSYTFSVHSRGLTGDGAADPTRRAARISTQGTFGTGSATVDLVLLDQQAWAKVTGLTGIPENWMHLDVARIGKSLGLTLNGGDPADSSGLLAGVVSAQRQDANHYTAVIDLGKASGVAVDAATVAKLGAKAKTVPAKITLDDQGRLTDLTLDLASVDPSLAPVEISYSGYGQPVTVTPPSDGTVTEAPNSLYQLLGG